MYKNGEDRYPIYSDGIFPACVPPLALGTICTFEWVFLLAIGTVTDGDRIWIKLGCRFDEASLGPGGRLRSQGQRS